jgi:DNA polymerase-3 subunit gamma/tau
MTYQVLARKWRPRRFDEMIGQDHVLRVLRSALGSDRLHHAYLFAGTRGVGKTTVARIFAKALNCEQGVVPEPCGRCQSCVEIDAGCFVDLIEVDAASRTRVEETRELLENVAYAPTRGRFKVYLIDEVHMFSNHSFNALLKTLEEPPPHVKFLFATTEVKKLPVTVLSRCLQLNLKRIAPERIEGELERILAEEQVASDPDSRRMIARAAEGSMRDALSLLDQAIAYGGGVLRAAEIGQWLGTVDRGAVVGLLQKLIAGNACEVLAEVDRMAEYAPDFEAVLAEVLGLLHHAAVAQVLSEAEFAKLDEEADIQALANSMTPEDCQLFYQTALVGRRDMPFTPDPRRGFEMTLLRMLAFHRDGGGVGAGIPMDGGTTPTQASLSSHRSRPAGPGSAGPHPAQAWHQLVEKLKLSGLARELALRCVPAGPVGSPLRLVVAPSARHLLNAATEARLLEALRTQLGGDLTLSISVGDPAGIASPAELQAEAERSRQEEACRAIASDPKVKALCEAFGAQVDPTAIRTG